MTKRAAELHFGDDIAVPTDFATARLRSAELIVTVADGLRAVDELFPTGKVVMIEDTDTHNAVVMEFKCNPALMVQEILRLRAMIARVEALRVGWLNPGESRYAAALGRALEEPATGAA